VIADPHLAEKASWQVEAHGTHIDRFLRCFEEMAKLTGVEKPDFALVCGDIHPAELEKCLDRVPLPLHVVPGNHENREARDLLRKLFPADFQVAGKPADYYAFTHKGVRFIALCDVGGGDHVGHLCSEYITPAGQCEWLEQVLARAEPARIVFGHIPPDPACGDRNMYLGRNDSRYLKELVSRTRPAALFFGHQHLATREVDFGGSRCVTLRSCAWNFQAAPLGFLLATVNGTTLTTREVLTSAAGPPPAK
jgi:3',5'-cyclic AMP phosphodiesterase CpdA